MLGLGEPSRLAESRTFFDAKGDFTLPRKPQAEEAYFGLGHSIRLGGDPHVFKVSLAGLALGACLVKRLGVRDMEGRILDLGTGSGVHALLLRSLGAESIVGTDICPQAVALAQQNEALNFGDRRIVFQVSDLFSSLSPNGTFDTIIFNPPGWRTPSHSLLARLAAIDTAGAMSPRSMFYGDQVLSRFLNEVPRYLSTTGRAIVGLNSMVGIRDVLEQYRGQHDGKPPLQCRLLERHTFPLLYYSPQWEALGDPLLTEFQQWRDQKLAAFSLDRSGGLYWSYEIVEFVRTGADYQ
jgi:release factor glutamine methyltransferase